jgi:hypothetical protein
MTPLLVALAGAAAWGLAASVMAHVPEWCRVLAALCVFLFGPGAMATWWLLPGAPALDRWTVALGFGLAAAPALAQVLGLVDAEAVFPYLASAMAAAALAIHPPSVPDTAALRSRSTLYCGLLVPPPSPWVRRPTRVGSSPRLPA